MPLILDAPAVRTVLRDWSEDSRDRSWAERAHEAYVSTQIDAVGRYFVQVDDEMLQELRRRVNVEDVRGERYTLLPGTGMAPCCSGNDQDAAREVAQEFVSRRGIEALRALMDRAAEALRDGDQLSEEAWRDIYGAAKGIIAARTEPDPSSTLRSPSQRP